MKLQITCQRGKLQQTLQQINVTTFIERKFNDLSQIMEKRLHRLEDEIIWLQNLNLSGNVANNKPVTSILIYTQASLKIVL